MVTGSYLLQRLSSFVWCVRPEFLVNIQNVLNSKFLEGFDFKMLKENDERFSDYLSYEIVGNKLVVNLDGVLMTKASWLDSFCGFISMQKVSSLLREAGADDRIDHIILVWDSPGGSAVGCEELSDLIYSLRRTKRITSLCAGEMCSAAYFIGSAADEVFASSKVVPIGSIGSYLLHVDQSQADKDIGLKYTYIAAGEYKTLGNPHEALDQKAYKFLQDQANYCYDVFLDHVARNRNLNKKDIFFAEGRVYDAGQAPKEMLDGFKTLEEILED